MRLARSRFRLIEVNALLFPRQPGFEPAEKIRPHAAALSSGAAIPGETKLTPGAKPF